MIGTDNFLLSKNLVSIEWDQNKFCQFPVKLKFQPEQSQFEKEFTFRKNAFKISVKIVPSYAYEWQLLLNQ